MKKRANKSASRFPRGWNQKRVRNVIEHYEKQTDEAGLAEDEAAWNDPKYTMMSGPVELVPQVQRLIARISG
jgi:hypothetical protein